MRLRLIVGVIALVVGCLVFGFGVYGSVLSRLAESTLNIDLTLIIGGVFIIIGSVLLVRRNVGDVSVGGRVQVPPPPDPDPEELVKR
jgi:hypothetical protein